MLTIYRSPMNSGADRRLPNIFYEEIWCDVKYCVRYLGGDVVSPISIYPQDVDAMICKHSYSWPYICVSGRIWWTKMMHEIFINIGNIRYSNFPISNPNMPTWQDEHGRLYCEAHRREVCDICCMSFDMPNRMQEEEVGILPKRTEVEKVADFIALIIKSLRDMHNMVPLPNEEVWAGNRGYLNDNIIKLRKFRDEAIQQLKKP